MVSHAIENVESAATVERTSKRPSLGLGVLEGLAGVLELGERLVAAASSSSLEQTENEREHERHAPGDELTQWARS